MLLEFEGFTLMAVIVATLVPFAVGFLWYGKPLFGPAWQKLVGLSEKDIAKANMPQVFGLSLVAAFVKAAFVGALLSSLAISYGVLEGLVTGGALGAGLVATSLLTQYLFAQRRKKLFLIDASYIVIEMALMGAVFGWLQ